MVRDGEVVIFNDPFSTLDYKTDCDVCTALRDTTAGMTATIVVQRIGTIRSTDKILVVDRERIVGTRIHDELSASNPMYREIALSQLNEGELA